jgi:glucose-6-phosphate dehydrogenase assembly protein OpcA
MSDAIWSAEPTTPEAIERALRQLVHERHTENGGFVPGRTLNLVCFVDRAYVGEALNRLRTAGRNQPSRLILLTYEPRRTALEGRVVVAARDDPQPAGGPIALFETVRVALGERHLDDLETIVDPLVATDVPTLLWAPHGHRDVLERLAPLAQAALLDSAAHQRWQSGLRQAAELSDHLYVVDLAWVRPAPWRARLAAAFSRPQRRAELEAISSLTVSHHPDYTASALLLAGWMASRLGWRVAPLFAQEGHGAVASGKVRGRRQEVRVVLRGRPDEQAPGLSEVVVETAGGRALTLSRGPGGLHAHERLPRGGERRWVILGASRGEGGVLGEGIRQALLRDPTYLPALQAAQGLAPL